MLRNQTLLTKIILVSLFTIVLVLGILLFINPPSVFPDPASGFQVMRAMEMGGKFNMAVAPSQDDIAKNTTEFLTWWSPGQYLAPYAVKRLLGLNTGQASAVVITVCQLQGLAGLFLFFKKIGFSPLVSAISILVISCQQFFVVPYVFYNGGEILFFAFAGCFLYGCTAIKATGWKLFLFVLVAGMLGFICKSSIMWVYGAGLIYLWLRLTSSLKKERIKTGAWIAMPALLAIGIIYLFFLAKGQNPASTSMGFKLDLKALAFPLASPLLSGFSIDDLSHGLIFHTGKPVFESHQAIIILFALAGLSLWLVLSIVRKVPEENYKLLLIVFYAAAILFFTYAYLRQMAISYEARHFRIIGLITIPGAVYLVSLLKLPYRMIWGVIWAGIAVTSSIYLVKGYSFNKYRSAHGSSGLAQEFIDQPSLDKVMAIDAQQCDAIFVFVNREIGLEIKHNRVLSLEPVGDNLQIDLDDYEHDGHAGPLYIILPDGYAGLKEKFILKAFPGYKGWCGVMLSEKYVMYAAK